MKDGLLFGGGLLLGLQIALAVYLVYQIVAH